MQKWFANLIRKHLVQDLPNELAFCESGCRKPTCTAAEFAVCPLRQSARTGGTAVVIPLIPRAGPAKAAADAPGAVLPFARRRIAQG